MGGFSWVSEWSGLRQGLVCLGERAFCEFAGWVVECWVAPGTKWSRPGGDQAAADKAVVEGTAEPLCWELAAELDSGVGLHVVLQALSSRELLNRGRRYHRAAGRTLERHRGRGVVLRVVEGVGGSLAGSGEGVCGCQLSSSVCGFTWGCGEQGCSSVVGSRV